MSTTVKYKGATLATVSNQTKTLLTSGTWLEDDIEVTDSVPAAQMAFSSGMIYGAPTITVASDGLVSSSWNNYGSPTTIYPIMQDGWATTSDSSVVYGEVTGTLQLSTRAAATITPGTSNQTISDGVYLTGPQTISGDANLVAGNIKSGTTIFGVTGTYAGSGGVGELLNTTSLGSINTSSTTAASVANVSVSDINTYDLLIVDCSVNTETNNRHTSTVSVVFLTGSSNAATTKNGNVIATAKWNSKKNSSGTHLSYQSTTAYGIYVNSCSISSGTATLGIYRRYNSTQTGTINGTYTCRTYGVKLIDLIGG